MLLLQTTEGISVNSLNKIDEAFQLIMLAHDNANASNQSLSTNASVNATVSLADNSSNNATSLVEKKQRKEAEVQQLNNQDVEEASNEATDDNQETKEDNQVKDESKANEEITAKGDVKPKTISKEDLKAKE